MRLTVLVVSAVFSSFSAPHQRCSCSESPVGLVSPERVYRGPDKGGQVDGEIRIRYSHVCNYVLADFQLAQIIILPQACYPQVSSLLPHGSRESFHKPLLVSGGSSGSAIFNK